MQIPIYNSHAGTQKERVPEEGGIGVFPMTIHFRQRLIILQKTCKMQIPIYSSHAGCQKERVPEEGEIGVFPMICNFLHALQAFSMSAYPRDAVSAAGPLCTHGKDKPGLGAPNSLKSFPDQL